MNVKLELLLKVAQEEHGTEALVQMVEHSMRKKLAPESLNAYLERNPSVRGAYERAKDLRNEPSVRMHNLAACIRKMGLDFTVDIRRAPWSHFPKGSTVAVVIGIRCVTIKEVSVTMRQKAVGARDMESLIELSNLLSNEFQTSSKLELHLLPPDMPPSDAESKLRDLQQRKDLGAIFVLGSPVTNRMCDPIARTILGGAKPPATFRWSHPRKNSFLSEPTACQRHEEGIRTAGQAVTDFPRVHDDQVLQLYRDGKRGPFPDCGILIIDCRVKPLLVLAAGHGGCGTKACIRALIDQEQIEKSLVSSGQWLFVVIRAKRKWKDDTDVDSTAPTDNLDLTYPKGWSFEWDDP